MISGGPSNMPPTPNAKPRWIAESVDDFLRGLRMSVEFGPSRRSIFSRVTQLINKTNQFNPTTQRYNRRRGGGDRRCAGDDLPAIPASRQIRDNGLISILILRRTRGRRTCCRSIPGSMSCRVFGVRLSLKAMNIASRPGIDLRTSACPVRTKNQYADEAIVAESVEKPELQGIISAQRRSLHLFGGVALRR